MHTSKTFFFQNCPGDIIILPSNWLLILLWEQFSFGKIHFHFGYPVFCWQFQDSLRHAELILWVKGPRSFESQFGSFVELSAVNWEDRTYFNVFKYETELKKCKLKRFLQAINWQIQSLKNHYSHQRFYLFWRWIYFPHVNRACHDSKWRPIEVQYINFKIFSNCLVSKCWWQVANLSWNKIKNNCPNFKEDIWTIFTASLKCMKLMKGYRGPLPRFQLCKGKFHNRSVLMEST